MHSLDDFRAILTADEPLARHTWFRLGGPAQFVARPQAPEQLLGLLRRCRDAGLPARILAGGSNVLVRDEGVTGLVIHLQSPAFSDVTIGENRVAAGAAVPLTALISQTARAGLAGLEILTGIPGTVGGAVRGNAGSRQGVIGQSVRRVTVIDSSLALQVREHDDLSFAYRWSNLDEPVLLSAEFALDPEDPEAMVRRMRKIWIVKKERQPYGHQSCGCIFKNPSPDLSAATLIEQAGLKGARIGAAEVSDRHANFIVAEPGATAAHVLQLIDRIRDEVARRFHQELELQIQIW